jgi:uncharacterized protein with HEPN domain/predicted transcriptional regulator
LRSVVGVDAEFRRAATRRRLVANGHESHPLGTLAELLANSEKQDAVVRNLEIIGEAVGNIPPEFRKKHGDIARSQIAGFRDRLIHQYFGVNWTILWDAVQEKLPTLRTQVEDLLRSEEPDDLAFPARLPEQMQHQLETWPRWYDRVTLGHIAMARTTSTLTISLPPEMLEELERVRKQEHRTRSELLREALRMYFSKRILEEAPTTAELRAIRRGRAAIARGDFVTLDELRDEVGTASRRPRKKSA